MRCSASQGCSLFLDSANIKINSINIHHTVVGRKVAGVKGTVGYWRGIGGNCTEVTGHSDNREYDCRVFNQLLAPGGAGRGGAGVEQLCNS